MIFRWYDTYGIPRDLIAELTEEKHLTPDWQAFEEILKHQQEKTRQKSVFEQKEILSLNQILLMKQYLLVTLTLKITV